jgi:hypothetical protein
MKMIPVTPELIQIIEYAIEDSMSTISEYEEALEHYTDNAKKLVITALERRKQLLAVTKDLLIRYS